MGSLDNIRRQLSEFLLDYVEGESMMPDEVICMHINGLVESGMFESIREIEKELLKEKAILISFKNYFGISK